MAPSSTATTSGGYMTTLRVLLIDNYDSYTYNLAHLLTSVGAPPRVIRADAYDCLNEAGDYDAIVVSPGPGCPERDVSALVTSAVTQQNIPLLGVCLGHQALCFTSGARVSRNPHGPAHGVVATIRRTSQSESCALWRGVPREFAATRYHSLAVDPETLPPELVADAYTVVDNTLMAVHHTHYPLFGVQFHPESIASQCGKQIAANFIALATKLRDARSIPRSLPRNIDMKSNGNNNHTLKQSSVSRYNVHHRPLDVKHFDTEAIFHCLYAHSTPSFWLDSSTANQKPLHTDAKPQTPRGRFSLMGDAQGPYSERISYDVHSRTVNVTDCNGIITSTIPNTDIFSYLSDALAQRRTPSPPSLPLPFNGGYVGYLGYELKNQVPGIRESSHTSPHNDAEFIFIDRFIVIDHVEHGVHAVAITPRDDTDDATRYWFDTVERSLFNISPSPYSSSTSPTSSPAPPNNCNKLRFSLERSRSEYLDDIDTCLDEINAGTSYEVCLTNRIRTRLATPPNTLQVYTTLRQVNPAPYSAYLRLNPDLTVCSSSPESFLHITSGGEVTSKPIKGTRPRGATPAIDAQLHDSLSSSEKDRSENLMIVDLVRNDLSRACIAGSVHVPRLMAVESYASVHQLVSTVRGQLAPHSSAVDVVRAAYPMGSMTGAPKVRTLDIIDRLEHTARGVYSGSIGYFSLCGGANLSVVIRTAVINKCDIEVGVGGAIVALSQPEDEYEEVLTKGRAIMRALSIAITGSDDYILSTK